MAASRVDHLDTTPVDLATAAAIESAEARAWADLYGAAPAEFAGTAGHGSWEVGGALVLRWAASGRRYFSRAIGLGVTQPATPEAIDEILRGWEQEGITMFLLQSLPHCRPAEYEEWLGERGLEPFDAQDRIVRGPEPLVVQVEDGDRDLAVERVVQETADEWAEFVQRASLLETGQWLQRLVGRGGWHHYLVRKGGEVVAARSMHVDETGRAWLGIDAPVPGIRTDHYEPDAAACAFILADGLARGVRLFLADIEAPSPEQDTPAYEHFARLGFTRPYTRTHWARI